MPTFYGPPLHHLTTIADFAATVAPPSELPEFAFSPKTKWLSRHAMCAACGEAIHERPGQTNHWFIGDDGPFCPPCVGHTPAQPVYGPMVPPSISNPRKPGSARTLTHTEALHHSLETKFEPKTQGFLTPYGRSPAIHTMTFHDRHTELSWLVNTQRQELASLHEEMRANGLESVNFSAPSDDGDSEMEAAIAETDVRRVHYGYGVKGKDEDGRDIYYNLDEVVSIQRQIEWEQYVDACGTSLRIYAKVTPESRTISAEYVTPKRVHEPAITTDTLKPHIGKLRSLIGARSNEELLNDRYRAWYYGKAVLARMTPEQQLAWTRRDRRARAYLGIADDNSSRVDFANPLEEKDRGPQELGLHADDSSEEPSEFDLWPMTDEEFLNGLPEDPGFATWD